MEVTRERDDAQAVPKASDWASATLLSHSSWSPPIKSNATFTRRFTVLAARMEGKKRKREEERPLPVVTFHAPQNRTFDRVLKGQPAIYHELEL